MKKVIYCFSGTGNSLNAAKIIAAQIDGASIVSVKRALSVNLPPTRMWLVLSALCMNGTFRKP